MAKRMLVVDDEADIANMLAEYFRMEDFEVVVAHDGAGALAAVSELGHGGRDERAAGAQGDRSGFDIILLDVNMPGMDGFEVCRRIREHMSCPIMFLTARIEDVDQLDGFAAGADDYVLKPFSLAVLGRRVAAHMAREGRVRERELAVRFFGEITVDYAERTVTVHAVPARGSAAPAEASPGEVEGSMPAGGKPDGAVRALGLGPTSALAPEPASAPASALGSAPAPDPAPAPASTRVDLTKLEFDIVALLSGRPGQVFDRDAIYERVWGWDAAGDPSQVREHVRRIRNKLIAAGVTCDPIETVWGVGYKWVAR